MTTTLFHGLTLLEGGGHEAVNHLPVPAYVIGLIVFGILAALLVTLINFGKSRPHA